LYCIVCQAASLVCPVFLTQQFKAWPAGKRDGPLGSLPVGLIPALWGRVAGWYARRKTRQTPEWAEHKLVVTMERWMTPTMMSD